MSVELDAVNDRRPAPPHSRSGFTLVELLVVISIISIIMSLGLSAVQRARETARRMDCQNRMRQQVLALHLYHDANRRFPFGDDELSGTRHSWVTHILPHLEQSALAAGVDRSVPWDHPVNEPAIRQVLPVLRCPTSVLEFDGDTDYAAIAGSMFAAPAVIQGFNWDNGVLIRSSLRHPRPISIADVLDGTSNTICLGEVSDRLPEYHGLWADGRNTISHDNGPINYENFSEIYSLHTGGANVALSDGAVRFLTESIDLQILGGLCSRAGGEDVSGAWN